MKVLLSFVGDQDPISNNTNEEGSIVTLCRQLKPDMVYLYPTASGELVKSETQTHAEETRHWLETEISPSVKVLIQPLALQDPTDYEAILPQIHSALKGHPELKEECDIHLNCSSGTPQMKSVWLIIANSGLLPGCRLWQVMNPKFAAERVKELQIEFLEEENILNRLDVFAKQFLFSQMAEEMGRLRNISLFSERRSRARLLQKIFWVYQDWDMIKYKKAYKGDNTRIGLKDLAAGFKPVSGNPDDKKLKALLLQQVSILEKLQRTDGIETLDNLTDLYFNAHRCYYRGNYVDTLARFWRVYEGILYYHLRKTYGIEPAYPKNSLNRSNLSRLYNDLRGVLPSVALGVRRAETALRDVFTDKIFLDLINRSLAADECLKDKVGLLLTRLRETRNDSIAAHGMKPVEKQDATDALSVMKELFSGFFLVNHLEQYAFQYSTLKIVVGYLTKSFSA